MPTPKSWHEKAKEILRKEQDRAREHRDDHPIPYPNCVVNGCLKHPWVLDNTR